MTSKKEKLTNAAVATEKFFSNSQYQKKASESGKKKVFSFRSDSEDIAMWRAYAKIKGIPVDELGTMAMSGYIKSHPLTTAEETVMNTLIQK